MKFFRKSQKILLTAIIYGLCSAAWAASVSNTADIDLATFQFTQVSGSAVLTFSPFYSSVETTVNDNPDFSDDTQGDAISLFSDNGEFVSATTAIDQFDILAQTSVEPNGFANALAQHEFEYTVSGAGEIKISVDYSLFADFTDLNNQNITSFGLVELLDEGSNQSSDAGIFNGGLVSDPTEKQGTLDLLLSLNDGDTGYLNFIATSSSEVSAVPVPPAIILFSSSLLGLLLKRRSIA